MKTIHTKTLCAIYKNITPESQAAILARFTKRSPYKTQSGRILANYKRGVNRD